MTIRLKSSILLAIFLIVTTVAGATAFIIYKNGEKAAKNNADALFFEAVERAYSTVDQKLSSLILSANFGSLQLDVQSKLETTRKKDILSSLVTILQANEDFLSAYYGFNNGKFYQLTKVALAFEILVDFNAPASAKWAVQEIDPEQSPGLAIWTFLDPDLTPVGNQVSRKTEYDPRSRPWFHTALSDPGVTLSDPYLFFTLQKQGFTASRQIGQTGHVFGIDFMLRTLSNFIKKTDISDNGGLILFDQNQKLLAANLKFMKNNDLTTSSFPYDLRTEQGGENKIIADYLKTRGQLKTEKVHMLDQSFMWRVKYWRNGQSGTIGVAVVAPYSDFTKSFNELTHKSLIATLIIFIVVAPLAYLYSHRLSIFAVKLSADARKVRDMNFEYEAPVFSRITEFSILGHSFSHMKRSLSENTKALVVAQDKLARIVELGIAMAAQQDVNVMMDMTLSGAKEIANADGATLYLVENETELKFQIVKNTSLELDIGGDGNPPKGVLAVPLYLEGGVPNHKNVVGSTVLKGKTSNIEDAYDSTRYDFTRTIAFDKLNNYRSRSILTIPLRPLNGEVIGAIQLINAVDPDTGGTIAFSNDIQKFVEALAAQAATTLHNRELTDDLEKLMDSLIKLIAGAIDAKSPYTGGHCERVPELSIMLAEAASASIEGSLASFSFTTEAEWREFRIGAWLHDCGKVTTPEFVVDKATKLETIYDRIHEIRMRFEVLRRDAEISLLKKTLGKDALTTIEQQLLPIADDLTRDFEFVAKCNVGAEFMADEKIDRINNLADKKWFRYFDNRLGLGPEESLRVSNEAQTLPVEEPLLADRPDHIIARERNIEALYDGYDFNLTIPDHLYNRGEIHNLSVKKGTLTEEERFKINEHIMQTIVMLEKLPLSKDLKRVPEYAGTHHETLTGSGYPRKLGEEDLSIPARITALADIFEALTASDRPYKKAKTLSESIKILSFFKKDRHIDPELFDLFLTSGIYLEYARKYLSEDQIDAVNISEFIG